MSYLFAMTFPALVVLLIVGATIEVVLSRRRRDARAEKNRRKPVVATVAIDTIGLALAPSTRHKLEHDEFMEVKRDEEGDAAPPRSTVDLDSGIARLVVPRPDPAPDADDAR